eukprot:gene25870-11540_t
MAPTVKFVARVNTTFRFDGLCDYQYLPIDPGSRNARDYQQTPAGNEPKQAEPSQVAESLMTMPPIFSKADVPFDYSFKQFHALPSTSKKQIPPLPTLSNVAFLFQKSPSHFRNLTLSAATEKPLPEADFDGSNGEGERPDTNHHQKLTLTAATEKPLPEPDIDGSDVEALANFVKLQLELRPIWCIHHLLETLLDGPCAEGCGWGPSPQETRVLLEEVLKKLCYTFKTGSTAGGTADGTAHDVAVSLTASRDMAIDDPVEGPLKRAKPPTMKEINSFTGLPCGRYTPLQLCDLDDSKVRSALILARSQDVCRDISGWLPPALLDSLKFHVVARFQSLPCGRYTPLQLWDLDDSQVHSALI